MAASNEFELAQPPTDGISALAFDSPDPNLLLASSWDTNVRLYNALDNTCRTTFAHPCPVLDTCFQDTGAGFSGGLDHGVRFLDFASGQASVLGRHEAGVKALAFSKNLGSIISGSWDKTVKIWDRRGREPTLLQLPDKVYTMDISGDRLIVGTAGRHVWIWDLRNMSAPEQRRESSLKFQTRSIRCTKDGKGYVLSSIEGRVAVEYFDPSPEVQSKKYAFKCHRAKDANGKDIIYPVNALAFHPIHGTFATGGCDGMIFMWDGNNKKRLCQFHKYPTSISALAFNETGTHLAIASSYTYEEGDQEHPSDSIFVRKVSDLEVKPK